MLPKVSVVVPVYNVEKYLEHCVESIINQTYVNLEIILVNDGSPDNCGKIIDEYAVGDERIVALHKENGGLSDARNFGVQEITGEYTLFVDSDDWLDKTMVEKMVKYSMENKADIVQTAFYYAYDSYLLFDKSRFHSVGTTNVLENFSLMNELIKNEIVKNFAWGKLYRTAIIKDIPFEKGVLFEDVFWAHQVMHRVNTYVINHEPLYYYRQREDSIVSTYTLKNLDILKGLKLRHDFIVTFYKELADESLRGILKTSLTHYNLLLINRRIDKKGIYRKEIHHYIQANYSSFIKAAEEDKDLRKQLKLFNKNPYLNVIFLFIRKILRKAKSSNQQLGLRRINLN